MERQLGCDKGPAVVSIDMGYGHLRAARPLGQLLGTEVLEVDKPPVAGPEEQLRWQRARSTYEGVSRTSQVPILGTPFRFLLDSATQIPNLYPYRDLSAQNLTIRLFERMIIKGFGEGLAQYLADSGRPLLTTFYAPALIADYYGVEDIYCVVTDTDIHRIWAPIDPRRTNIHYFTPSQRATRRLRAYGVPQEHIHFTGFPLPHGLVGGPQLKTLTENLRRRLVRLDPQGAFRKLYKDEVSHFLGDLPSDQEKQPPRLSFAVGGAGAQSEMVELFLPRMRQPLFAGRLKLTLVAGVRQEVADYFTRQLTRFGLERQIGRSVDILIRETKEEYFDAFDQLLAETDILYTKPSELTFYAALGVPLVCAWPVGHHERLNRRFVLEAGAGLKQWDPRHTAEWLREWLDDGTLAAAAWSGFMRLPKTGSYRILEHLGVALPDGIELPPASSRRELRPAEELPSAE